MLPKAPLGDRGPDHIPFLHRLPERHLVTLPACHGGCRAVEGQPGPLHGHSKAHLRHEHLADPAVRAPGGPHRLEVPRARPAPLHPAGRRRGRRRHPGLPLGSAAGRVLGVRPRRARLAHRGGAQRRDDRGDLPRDAPARAVRDLQRHPGVHVPCRGPDGLRHDRSLRGSPLQLAVHRLLGHDVRLRCPAPSAHPAGLPPDHVPQLDHVAPILLALVRRRVREALAVPRRLPPRVHVHIRVQLRLRPHVFSAAHAAGPRGDPRTHQPADALQLHLHRLFLERRRGRGAERTALPEGGQDTRPEERLHRDPGQEFPHHGRLGDRLRDRLLADALCLRLPHAGAADQRLLRHVRPVRRGLRLGLRPVPGLLLAAAASERGDRERHGLLHDVEAAGGGPRQLRRGADAGLLPKPAGRDRRRRWDADPVPQDRLHRGVRDLGHARLHRRRPGAAAAPQGQRGQGGGQGQPAAPARRLSGPGVRPSPRRKPRSPTVWVVEAASPPRPRPPGAVRNGPGARSHPSPLLLLLLLLQGRQAGDPA
mmetsp:Transcript_117588/g.315295  ORF Transcript_117588/g.315295 Transcript_117588/m.315295 type:complete len:537 (+) Transcript_117588:596-2206(+)